MPLAVAAGVLSVTLAGCVPFMTPPSPPTSAPETSAAQTTPTPSATPTQSTPVAVSFTAPYHEGQIKVDVHQIQTKGDLAVLTVDYTSSGYKSFPYMGIALMYGVTDYGAGGIRLVDPETETLYEVPHANQGLGTDLAATKADKFWPKTGMSKDGTVTSTGLYPAPSAAQIDVLFPNFGYAKGIPVISDTTGAVDAAIAEFGQPRDVASRIRPMRPFSWSFDQASGAEKEGDVTTVTVRSDVLFATDKYQLTAKATKIVDEAAAAIKKGATGAHAVTVTGHTDDVGATAYNQTLSERRAKSVADRLAKTLGPGFTIKAVGKGETQPKVDGTSADARAANRRVEIAFTGTLDGPATGPATAPKAPAATTSGTQPVSLTVPIGSRKETFTLNAIRVQRSGKVLAGTFAITGPQVMGGLGVDLLYSKSEADALKTRGIYMIDRMWTQTAGVTLLSSTGWQYPYIYQLDATSTVLPRAVGDWNVKIQNGGQTSWVTTVWPDVDPSQTSVTAEVPGLWRITDIPIDT